MELKHDSRQKRAVFQSNKTLRANSNFSYINGEFDPGSGRTLAACLTHASRTEFKRKLANLKLSGGRVSNAWITYLKDWDNTGKLVLIPDKLIGAPALMRKGAIRIKMGPRPIS